MTVQLPSTRTMLITVAGFVALALRLVMGAGTTLELRDRSVHRASFTACDELCHISTIVVKD